MNNIGNNMTIYDFFGNNLKSNEQNPHSYPQMGGSMVGFKYVLNRFEILVNYLLNMF